jgi:hypothetical protein
MQPVKSEKENRVGENNRIHGLDYELQCISGKINQARYDSFTYLTC